MFLGANWSVYIWAVTNEHMVDASLGQIVLMCMIPSFLFIAYVVWDDHRNPH